MSCEPCEVLQGGIGAGPSGAVPFGSRMPNDVKIGVERIHQISLNQVAVPYFGDVGFPNPRNPLSPLYPGNWSLTVIEPPGPVVRLIQRVQLVTEFTLPVLISERPQLGIVQLPAFLVTFDGALTEGAEYELTLFGQTVTPGTCDCAQFEALFVRCEAVPRDGRDADGFLIDLANPYLSRDALRLPPVLGSYQITDKGDLGLDKSGEASLRKRIQRRMVSSGGDFFHLLGYGVNARAKELLTIGALQRLQSRLRAQILKEPEVVQVQVSVRRMLGEQTVIAAAARVQTLTSATPLEVVAPIELP